MQKLYWIALILIGTFLTSNFVPYVSAGSYHSCDSKNYFDTWIVADCVGTIVEQNKIIEKQNNDLLKLQNQTNYLLAADICTHIFGPLDFNTGVIDNSTAVASLFHSNLGYLSFHDCITTMLKDSKR